MFETRIRLMRALWWSVTSPTDFVSLSERKYHNWGAIAYRHKHGRSVVSTLRMDIKEKGHLGSAIIGFCINSFLMISGFKPGGMIKVGFSTSSRSDK
ncbi:hypothetical protein J2X69_001215 [Algoriphagus sp. 4150]|uniref:hypothetical protein n=1 Tax=Algoriphagus sp. 4150 TaxID=2817756 RepID=UPI00285FEF1B|nr:hypothetical protein [Algoriphagus sp. 4150]MDR7128883.1 hypothetical protein [Algoriphagus sp. 4150]